MPTPHHVPRPLQVTDSGVVSQRRPQHGGGHRELTGTVGHCGRRLHLVRGLRRRLPGGGGGDVGSMAVELAVLAPAIGLLIGFVIAAGRLSLSQGVVQAAAVDAARMASISRSADAAQTAASTGAQASLQGQPHTCSPFTVTANTTGFAVRVGAPAQVEVTVVCHVPLANLLPGLPGSKTITKTAISPLDTYRERTS